MTGCPQKLYFLYVPETTEIKKSQVRRSTSSEEKKNYTHVNHPFS